MSNNQSKITASFILLDANSKLLKNIEYKVTTVKGNKENHLVKGKTNSKGATYEFVKPISTKLCLYIKIGSKDFKKVACLLLPSTSKSKLKIRARVSAILIDSKLKEHGSSAGSVKRKDYKVVTDDTLESIAQRHNTEVSELKRLNPKIKSIHKIFAGDWLKVPAQLGDTSKDTTDNSSPKPMPTEPAKANSKNDTSIDLEQPWYEKAWNNVKDGSDKIDAVINKAEESIKQGQQKIINGTLDAKEHVAETSGKLYDKVFSVDEPSKTNNKNNPAKTESLDNKNKASEPPLEIKKDAGNNQKGNPSDQITYDSDTTVYHIYYDGHIERANKQAIGYAAFIYYDEGGSKHFLGKTKYLKTPRYGGGGHIYLVNIGGDKKSNGIDDNNLSNIEKEKRLSKYRKGNVGYSIYMNSQQYQRYYLSGIAMATFLGALCKLGYDDISFNGASKVDGGPGPSSSHTNGKCIDVRYLRKDRKALEMILNNHSHDSQYDHDRNLKLVNTLYEFGWGKRKRPDDSIVKMLSVYFTNSQAGINKRYILPHCGPYKGHDNHLHLQGLVANIKDIDIISRAPIPDVAFPAYCNQCLTESNFETITSKGTVRISEKLMKAIMDWEGRPKNPYVPGGSSGITLGYGYDLGHQTDSSARKTLSKYFYGPDLQNLLYVVGYTGQKAKNNLDKVKHISISENSALRMFEELIPDYAERTVKIYPQIVDLHPDCQGSLVSLVYNRGSSLKNIDSRTEMINIVAHLNNGHLNKIPNEFRSMKRIWKNKSGVRGLLSRRDQEASYFEEGLEKHSNH